MAEQEPASDAEQTPAGGRGCFWHIAQAIVLAVAAAIVLSAWIGTMGALVSMGLGTPGKATVGECSNSVRCPGDFDPDNGPVRRHVSISGDIKEEATVRARRIGGEVWMEDSAPWWAVFLVTPTLSAWTLFHQRRRTKRPARTSTRKVPAHERVRDLAPVAVIWTILGSLVYAGSQAMSASSAAATNGDPTTIPATATILCGVGIIAVSVYVHLRRP